MIKKILYKVLYLFIKPLNYRLSDNKIDSKDYLLDALFRKFKKVNFYPNHIFDIIFILKKISNKYI
jgi:hypothetical protein